MKHDDNVSFSEILKEAEHVFAHADKSVLDEFVKRASSYVGHWIDINELFDNKYVNLDFCVDYSSDYYSFGDGFVYAWVTDNGNLFYIGSGTRERVTNMANRSKEFLEIVEEENCQPILICGNVDRGMAREIEKMCIWYVSMYGAELVNKADILTAEEKIYFSLYEQNKVLMENRELEEKYELYDGYKWQYEKVCLQVDLILDYCLKLANSTIQKFEKKPTKLNDEFHYQGKELVTWTIDGIKKTASQWCKEYKKGYSSVVTQMKRYELTLEEALSLPVVPAGRTRDPLQFWKECGFDVKPRPIPLDSMPKEYLA